MNAFPAPVRASLDMTYACDLRCIHCRTNTGEIPINIRRAMLSIDQIRQVMLDLDDMGTFEITLTGGEPTMRKGFWSLLPTVQSLKQSTVTLITNAAALTHEQMDQLIDGGISSVRVSIDGTRHTFEQVRLADAFNTVLENTSYLNERVPSLKVLTTVMKTNLENIFELVDCLRENGIRRQDLILVRAHGRGGRNRLLLTEEETLLLHDKVEEFRRTVAPEEFDLNLNAPYLVPNAPIAPVQDVVMFPYLVRDASCAVSATGDVTMSRLYSPAPLGNVKDASIKSIWASGQTQMTMEEESFDEERLRHIFWDFANAEGTDQPVLTSLLDRQIFEGFEVR